MESLWERVRTLRGARLLLSLLLLVGAAGCGYNEVIERDEAVKAGWAEVENQYQRRADVVPNLVRVVQGASRRTRHLWLRFGYLSILLMVVLIPERNVGFYIAVNSEESALLHGLTWELVDHYLGRPRHDWPDRFNAFLSSRLQQAAAVLAAPAAQPARVGPSLPLARYAGRYQDPWFGTITIREEGDRLHVDFPHWPGLTATLEHWQYDTFRTRYNDSSVEPAYVTFQLDANGQVDRITMRSVSPAADFSYDYQDLLFTPVRDAAAR